MSRYMTKKVVLALGLALILAAGGLATASNMGFKFVKSYSAVDPLINTVSLPYFQSQFTNANEMFNDIPNAVQVCRVNTNGSRTCWLGDFTGSPNFSVTGTSNHAGLVVGVSAASTEVIVGSHDPALNVGSRLTSPDPSVFLIAMPYHATYTQGNEVFNDIPNAVQFCRQNTNGSRTCWLGDFTGSPNFSIVLGDAYIVSVNPASPSWVPDHY